MLGLLVRLYRQLFRRQGVSMGVCMLAQLLTQTAMLVVLLCPLLILHLFLPTGQHVLFDTPVSHWTVDQQLYLYVMLAGIGYGLYYGCNRYQVWKIRQMTTNLLEQVNKSRLTLNLESKARTYMLDLVKLPGLGLVLMVFWGLLLWVYPELMVALTCYLCMVAYIFIRRGRQDVKSLKQLVQPYYHVSMNMGIVAILLLCFYQFKQHTLPTLLQVYLALLLIRKVMMYFFTIVSTWAALATRQEQLAFLFVDGSPLPIITTISEFEQQFAPDRLTGWLSPMLSQQWASPIEPHQIELLQVRLRSQATMATLKLRVSPSCLTVRSPGLLPLPILLWIELFSPSRSGYARHAHDLVRQYGASDPSVSTVKGVIPLFRGMVDLGWCHCLIFEMEQDQTLLTGQLLKSALPQLKAHLAALQVEQTVLAQYYHHYDDLQQRLDRINWTRYHYLTPVDRQAAFLDDLIQHWSMIKQQISRLPKVMSLSKLVNVSVVQRSQADYVIYGGWEHWVYDTLGCYWQITPQLESEITQLVDTWLAVAPDMQVMLASCNASKTRLIQTIVLAAKLHEFAQRYHQANLDGTLLMIKGILHTYTKLAHKGKTPLESIVDLPV